jgi:hypothetical protein
MEFCSLRELQNQTGHQVWDWPLVVLKELFDNALELGFAHVSARPQHPQQDPQAIEAFKKTFLHAWLKR